MAAETRSVDVVVETVGHELDGQNLKQVFNADFFGSIDLVVVASGSYDFRRCDVTWLCNDLPSPSKLVAKSTFISYALGLNKLLIDNIILCNITLDMPGFLLYIPLLNSLVAVPPCKA